MGLTKTSGQLAPAGLRSVVVRGHFPRALSFAHRPPVRRPHRAIRRLCFTSAAGGRKRATGKFPQNRQTREAAGGIVAAGDERESRTRGVKAHKKESKRERSKDADGSEQAAACTSERVVFVFSTCCFPSSSTCLKRELIRVCDTASSREEREDSTERDFVDVRELIDTDSWRICRSNNNKSQTRDDIRMARTASGKGSTAMIATGEDREAQQMRACDFDTLQMEQAEFLMTTIMDARAAQDAFDDLDEWRMPSPSAAADGDGGEDSDCSLAPEIVKEAALLSPEEPSSVTPPATPVISTSSPSSALPVPPLTLSILESDEGQPGQWNPLISPLREEYEEEEEAELSSPELLSSGTFCNQDSANRVEAEDDAISIAELDSEAEMERTLRQQVMESEKAKALKVKRDNGEGFTVNADLDEDDEEFDVYNAYTVVKEENGCNKELYEEKLDSTATEEDENEDCTDGTRTSVATTLDDSCEESPRASSSAAASRMGRRFRANTYTGAASTYVRNGCAMIRSRTLSSASSFRNSSQSSTSEIEADVDFSSDDEGYSRDRVSDMSSGSGRFSLRSRISSVGGSFRVPTNMKFLRYRTSSATTTTSEDSFCNDSSYANSPRSTGEVHLAPLSFSSAEAFQQEQNNHYQMQALKLKASACAFKAAGYLNAASAEAARKLKSKTFRSAKPVASATDVDADLLPSPPSWLVHDGA